MLGEQLSNDEEDSVSEGGSLSTSQEWEESHVLSASHEWEESRPLASHKEQEPSLVLTSYLTSQHNLEESHVMSSYHDQGVKHMLASLQEQQKNHDIALNQPRNSSHTLALSAPTVKPPDTSQESHIFAGTSQEYQQPPAELVSGPTPSAAYQPDTLTNIPVFDRLPYEQLEALYAAQKRRIKELEESYNAFHQESEREV